MIVKNEELYLERCLTSVREVTDDIVIVDTGSQDRTLEIANQYSARIQHIEWPNDFAKARNVSLDMVKTPWTLVMDADEELVADDVSTLQTAITTPIADAYNLRIVSLANKVENLSESYVTRLFRTHPAVRFSGIIHEQIFPALAARQMKLMPLDVRLLHYGYMDGVSNDRQKGERNRDLLRAALHHDPNDTYMQWQLAQTLLNLGQYEEASTLCRKTLGLLQPDNPFIPLVYVTYAKALHVNSQSKRALRILQEAINQFPTYTDLHYLSGILLMSLGRFETAIRSLQQCVSLGEATGFLMTETGIGGFKSLYRLAQCYASQKEAKSALAYTLMTLKSQPAFRDGWLLLFQLLNGHSVSDVIQTVELALSKEMVATGMASWPDRNPIEEALWEWAHHPEKLT